MNIAIAPTVHRSGNKTETVQTLKHFNLSLIMATKLKGTKIQYHQREVTIEGNVSTVQQKELAIVQKDITSSREAYHTRFHDINVQRSYRKCTGPDHAQATVGCSRSSLSDKGGRTGHPDPELRG